MIKIENIKTWGFEHAIRGMRNPMNSWNKSDSVFIDELDTFHFKVGNDDLDLMNRLYHAGTEHRKYLRQIFVSMDITAPLYWWKEADTYKIGTVSNSCSTMHKIHSKEFTLDDFSCEHLINGSSKINLMGTIELMNQYRNQFITTNNKEYWWQMIQLLPSSYNQKRTVILNYAVLKNMYHARKEHKLDEWREFCKWIESLPYSEVITEC